MDRSVLLIAFHFPPQAASSGIQRTVSFSKYLGNHGWNPIVLSAKPMAYDCVNISQLETLPKKIVIKRTFALDAKRHMGVWGHYPEAISLPDQWVSWCLSAIPAGIGIVRQHKPQVIWSTFPIATTSLIALAIQRITGLPWIADFRDPMLQKNFPTRKMQRAVFSWIEKQTIYKCQKAVFTTHSAMHSYRKRFPEISRDKFVVIENGYDEESFNSTTPTQCIDFQKCKNSLTLLHSGTLYADDRDPSDFFLAISLLERAGRLKNLLLKIVFRATGDDRYFYQLIEKYNISQIVKLAPPLPYLEALHEMQEVDGLLVFQGNSANDQIPAKIYEYLRARKPIFGLLDIKGETANLLQIAGFQDIAPIDSSAEIMVALESFFSKLLTGSAWVATNEFISKLSRKERTADLAEILDQVAGAFDA